MLTDHIDATVVSFPSSGFILQHQLLLPFWPYGFPPPCLFPRPVSPSLRFILCILFSLQLSELASVACRTWLCLRGFSRWKSEKIWEPTTQPASPELYLWQKKKKKMGKRIKQSHNCVHVYVRVRAYILQGISGGGSQTGEHKGLSWEEAAGPRSWVELGLKLAGRGWQLHTGNGFN